MGKKMEKIAQLHKDLIVAKQHSNAQNKMLGKMVEENKELTKKLQMVKDKHIAKTQKNHKKRIGTKEEIQYLKELVEREQRMVHWYGKHDDLQQQYNSLEAEKELLSDELLNVKVRNDKLVAKCAVLEATHKEDRVEIDNLEARIIVQEQEQAPTPAQVLVSVLGCSRDDLWGDKR